MIFNPTLESEKQQKATLIENMLSEVGMTKQELIDLFVSVSEEVEVENKISQKDKENQSIINLTHAEIADLISNNVGDNLSKFLSFNELKKLENLIGYALYIKKAEQLGLKLDDAKIASILQIQAKNIKILSGAKIEIDGVKKSISSSKAKDLSQYLEPQISQSQNIQNQRNSPSSQSQGASNQQSPNFLSRISSAIQSQVQSAVSSVFGAANRVDASANMLRVQTQVRQVEAANRQLKRQQQKASALGNILKSSVNRAGEKQVTIRVKDKSGVVSEKTIGLKELAKEKNIPINKAEELVKDIDKANSNLEKSVKSLQEKTPDVKIIAITNDDKGRVIIEAEIKGQRFKIPAEQFSTEIKSPKQDSGNISEGKTKKEGYESEDGLKIYEQVGSSKNKGFNSEKMDKMAKSENLKFELNKLDAISDLEKLRKNQEKQNTKEGASAEIDSERPDAVKKASDIVDEHRDPSLKYMMNKPVDIHKNDDPKEKTEIKESNKTHEKLKKLDAMMDKLEGLNEIKNSMKNAVADKMEEAMKNKDLMKDMQKEKMLNPENFLKR